MKAKATISIIAALDDKLGIARNNQIPWHIPEDLKFFKKTTLNHPIIMGRITYASINKALPERTNIIITRNHNFKAKDCLITHSLDEAIKLAKKIDSQNIFIIGGGEIYSQALPITDTLYLTRIKGDFNCNVFFPDYSQFNQVVFKKKSQDKNFSYTFYQLKKEKPVFKNL